MEIAGSLLVVGLCPVSAVTQESNEKPIAFLESLKEALQKFKNLNLRGTVDFFFNFFFISWRLITLQYCSGFCHTLTC